MDKNTLSAADFLAPILGGHAANDLERAMAGVFVSVVQDTQIESLNDIYSYGAPWQGTATVVERFTKLNGLAVLRRDDDGLSDKLMSVIYANWQAIASERGLGFLQFVLDMLYPNQSEIVQLWHSKAQAASYPLYVSETPHNDSFLTSRVRINISGSADLAELSELTPTLSRLTPWHVVPEVAVRIEAENVGLGMAAAGLMYQVTNLSPY